MTGDRTRGPQPGVARNTHHHRQRNPVRSGRKTHSRSSATSNTHTYTSSKPQPGKRTATRHTRTNTHGRHTHTHTNSTNAQRTHQHAPRHKHTQHGKPPTKHRGNGQSTYRLQADTEGTLYTVYTWARYGDLPAPIWHPDPSWHQPLHGRRVLRQSIEPAGSTATGTHGNPPPHNIINSALANARMPLIDTLCPTSDDTTGRRKWGTITRALHHDIDRDQATWINQGSIIIIIRGWLNTLNLHKLRRSVGPYILYPVPHGMDGPCQGLRPGDPPCGRPCPHALFEPLCPQPAPLQGVYLNTVTSAKGVYPTTGDTTGQAIPLNQVHHMALVPRLPNTDKPRHLLARHGARDPRPMDPNARGPDRTLLHVTMKHTAQLPATLAGEKYFIVEGLTEDVITLAANTLAATMDAWEVAAGHPTARKDRIQDTEDCLTPDLVNHLVTLTSPLEQQDGITEGPKVTDWPSFIDRPPDTPTVTLTCHQHKWWVAQWNATGKTDRVHTFTPEAKPATPLALGDRFKHSTHHTNHPRPHWLALKTAMHWTVDAPATDTTLPDTWLTLMRNLAAYVRKHGTAKAQRWMSWSADTERTLKLRTTSLQEHANKLRGMHRPQEGQGPAFSIFRRDAPKPAPKPAPEQHRPKPRPHPGGADISARRAKRLRLEPKACPAPPPPDQQPKPKAPACPFFTPAERAAMHLEWPDGAEVRGVSGATLRGQPKQFVWFWGLIQGRMATPGQHGNLQLKNKWHALPEWGEKSANSNLELWDDRQFPECPVQLHTPANQVPPGTIWTGDVPQTWLEEPDIPEKQRAATPINHKLRLGQDYYQAAPGTPQKPPRRSATRSQLRSSLSCPSTNQAPCTTRSKLWTYKTYLSRRNVTRRP